MTEEDKQLTLMTLYRIKLIEHRFKLLREMQKSVARLSFHFGAMAFSLGAYIGLQVNLREWPGIFLAVVLTLLLNLVFYIISGAQASRSIKEFYANEERYTAWLKLHGHWNYPN